MDGGNAQTAVRHTVVGLFEDTIDAEQALVALRKADHAADRVSLVVRDKAAEEDGGAVARAIVANALDAVGGWLQGLASLIVPERGTFLVAGPIGAVLVGIGTPDAAGGSAGASTAHATAGSLGAGGLLRTLADFGFTPDEASYLDHRLAAGTALVAVTSGDEPTLQATRRLFADHDAVYIGMAQTDAGFLLEAEALLASPPEASGGDLVVTDAVAPIQRVSQEGGSPQAALRGREAVDADGDDAGKIEDVLEEAVDPDGPAGPEPERLVPRYLVVRFGGLLGLGRHHVAIPVALADLSASPVRLRVDKEQLQRAPRYDADAPFSRREESIIYAFFGLQPYWQDA